MKSAFNAESQSGQPYCFRDLKTAKMKRACMSTRLVLTLVYYFSDVSPGDLKYKFVHMDYFMN